MRSRTVKRYEVTGAPMLIAAGVLWLVWYVCEAARHYSFEQALKYMTAFAIKMEFDDNSATNSPSAIVIDRRRLDDAFWHCLERLETVRSIRITSTKFDDADASRLRSMWRLEAVYLPASDITDAGVAELAKLPYLKILDLSDTQITDESVSKLTKSGSLEELYLRNTRVGDHGLQWIHNIRRLDITGTGVTPERAKTISRWNPQARIDY
jgi:hypothetical protein